MIQVSHDGPERRANGSEIYGHSKFAEFGRAQENLHAVCVPVQALAVSWVAAKAVCGVELLFNNYLKHRSSGLDGLAKMPIPRCHRLCYYSDGPGVRQGRLEWL
jgi:hypothetical protein